MVLFIKCVKCGCEHRAEVDKPKDWKSKTCFKCGETVKFKEEDIPAETEERVPEAIPVKQGRGRRKKSA